ncbi:MULTISPECIES: hypothetical protein [Pseudomonas]|uniref:hypothetical protein n=1 Tax=Pseudomonas TaxID=286 RepID=UPI0010BFC781|nr:MULTISPECIES: hypothetical protein [Pseudomonas]
MNAIQNARADVHSAQLRVDRLAQQRDSIAAELLVAEAALRCAHAGLNQLKAADSRLLADARRDELAQLRDRIAAAKQPLAEKVDPVQEWLDRLNWVPISLAVHLASNGQSTLAADQLAELDGNANARFRVQAERLIANKAWPGLSDDIRFDSLNAALASARQEQVRIFNDAVGAR